MPMSTEFALWPARLLAGWSPWSLPVDLATGRCTDGENPKMSSKRYTDLEILPSKAKNLEEPDFDVRKGLAPRKSTENYEKLKKKSDLFSEKKKFGRQKIEIGKSSETLRALPKFRSDRSEVRGVNRRSKFVVASAGRAEQNIYDATKQITT